MYKKKKKKVYDKVVFYHFTWRSFNSFSVSFNVLALTTPSLACQRETNDGHAQLTILSIYIHVYLNKQTNKLYNTHFPHLSK